MEEDTEIYSPLHDATRTLGNEGVVGLVNAINQRILLTVLVYIA